MAGPSDRFRERQPLSWGTTDWRARYGGRNLVETANSLLKTHKARYARGSVRVRGLFKNAFLAAVILATVNIAALMSGHDYDIGDPLPAIERNAIATGAQLTVVTPEPRTRNSGNTG